jgi:thioredoxin-disulfide reductase
MDKYDVIIIGGACAGLSAGIYAGRRELKTLVLTKDIGGQIATTTEVENYPGIETILGPKLAMDMKAHAEKSGSEIKMEEVKEISKNGNEYVIVSEKGEYVAPVVILTFGLKQRTLNLPGEKELTGRGVAYCATCDGPLYRNKIVGVVGGGNAAFESAEYLSTLAEKVYLFVRRDEYRAESVLIETVKKAKNIEIMNFTEIESFEGEQMLQKVKLINNKTSEKSELELNGVFIEIGWISQINEIKGLKDLVNVDERGYVKVDNQNKTSAEGLFAAGDVTDTPFKQAVISAGEGAKAAMAAGVYIQKLKGQDSSVATPDWKKKK